MGAYVSPWNLIKSMKAIDSWTASINANLVGSTRIGYKQSDVLMGGGTTTILHEPGLGPAGTQIAETTMNIKYSYIDFSQGDLSKTANWTDVAIDGEGFFMTSDVFDGPFLPENIQYTRDGQFHLDELGYLRTKEGLYVLDGNTVPGDPDVSLNSVPPWANSVFDPSPAGGNDMWTKRERLVIENTFDHDLTRDTVIELNLDTLAYVNKGEMQNNLDDLRIGYYDEVTTPGTPFWVDLPRVILGPVTDEHTAPANGPDTASTDTTVRFRIQEDLAAGDKVFNKYYLFYDYAPGGPGGTAPTPTPVPIRLTIGEVDPNDPGDNFGGLYNPADDQTTTDGIHSVEDWLNVTDTTNPGGQKWRVMVPDSPSTGWDGLKAGNIDYIKDGITGYTVNGVALNNPATGASNYGAITATKVFKVKVTDGPSNILTNPNTSLPPHTGAVREGGWMFVDVDGNEIIMTAIDGTNNAGAYDPNYDFTLSSADLNAGATNLDPTLTDWLKFNPSQITIGNKPVLNNGSSSLNYNDLPNNLARDINYGQPFTAATILAPTTEANRISTGWQPMSIGSSNGAAPWGLGTNTSLSRNQNMTYNAIKSFTLTAAQLTGNEQITFASDWAGYLMVNGNLISPTIEGYPGVAHNISSYLQAGENTIFVQYTNNGPAANPEGIKVTATGFATTAIDANVSTNATWAVQYNPAGLKGNPTDYPTIIPPPPTAAEAAAAGGEGRWGDIDYTSGSGVTNGDPLVYTEGGWLANGTRSANGQMWYPGGSNSNHVIGEDPPAIGSPTSFLTYKKTYYNDTDHDVNVTINTGVNGFARFYLNGTQFSTGTTNGNWDDWTTTKKYTITLHPGANEMKVEAYDDNMGVSHVSIETIQPSNLTFEAWVKPDSTINPSFYSEILNRESSYELAMHNGHLAMAIMQTGTNNWWWTDEAGVNGTGSPPIIPIDGAFHHVVGQYDGTTMKLYVDGVLGQM